MVLYRSVRFHVWSEFHGKAIILYSYSNIPVIIYFMYGLYSYSYKNIIYIMVFTLIGSSWEHLWTIQTIQELLRDITPQSQTRNQTLSIIAILFYAFSLRKLSPFPAVLLVLV
jgi:hypothetical protein